MYGPPAGRTHLNRLILSTDVTLFSNASHRLLSKPRQPCLRISLPSVMKVIRQGSALWFTFDQPPSRIFLLSSGYSRLRSVNTPASTRSADGPRKLSRV